MFSYRCEMPGCHRHRKVDDRGRALIAQVAHEMGQQAGLICPRHVQEAIDGDDSYQVNLPIGEMMVETARINHGWFIVTLPTCHP